MFSFLIICKFYFQFICQSFHYRSIMKRYWTYFVHLKINLSAFEKTLKRALRLGIYIFANIIVSFFAGGRLLQVKFWFQYFR